MRLTLQDTIVAESSLRDCKPQLEYDFNFAKVYAGIKTTEALVTPHIRQLMEPIHTKAYSVGGKNIVITAGEIEKHCERFGVDTETYMGSPSNIRYDIVCAKESLAETVKDFMNELVENDTNELLAVNNSYVRGDGQRQKHIHIDDCVSIQMMAKTGVPYEIRFTTVEQSFMSRKAAMLDWNLPPYKLARDLNTIEERLEAPDDIESVKPLKNDRAKIWEQMEHYSMHIECLEQGGFNAQVFDESDRVVCSRQEIHLGEKVACDITLSVSENDRHLDYATSIRGNIYGELEQIVSQRVTSYNFDLSAFRDVVRGQRMSIETRRDFDEREEAWER